MRAAVLPKIHDALQVTEVEDPIAAPGGVVVRLRAAALNHRDAWIRKGLYPRIRLPCVLGSDGAGEIAEVGAGVDPAWLGRRVLVHPFSHWGPEPRAQQKEFLILGMPEQGTLAEKIAVPLGRIELLPAHLSFREGAAWSLGGLTAYRALVSRGEVKSGEHVLITGIGGGVATAALVLAKALGAVVSVTSSSAEKLDTAKALGAAVAVNYAVPGWEQQLLAQAGRAPSLIIDSAGGEGLNALIGVAAMGARIVMYGATHGGPNALDLSRIFFKQLDLRGTTMGSEADYRAMLSLVARQELRPVIDRVFSLEDAPRALARMEASSQMGKIVIEM